MKLIEVESRLENIKRLRRAGMCPDLYARGRSYSENMSLDDFRAGPSGSSSSNSADSGNQSPPPVIYRRKNDVIELQPIKSKSATVTRGKKSRGAPTILPPSAAAVAAAEKRV